MEPAAFTCSRDRYTWIFTSAIMSIIIMVSASSYISLAMAGAMIPGILLALLNVILIGAVFVYLPLEYLVTDEQVHVRRAGPDITIARSDIRQVTRISWDTLKGSIRLGANGGLGGYVGLFTNKTLGRYRAYMTQKDNLVLIRTDDTVYVISPDTPDQFVALFAENIPSRN